MEVNSKRVELGLMILRWMASALFIVFNMILRPHYKIEKLSASYCLIQINE